MSDEHAEEPSTPSTGLLRREALLPTERNRGLGTVAVVCTMAGVASGLALATTLMAMQVADGMSSRDRCGYAPSIELQMQRDARANQALLGISEYYLKGTIHVDEIIAGSPAELAGLRHGDHILSMDGRGFSSTEDFAIRVGSQIPGTQHTFVVDRGGTLSVIRPVLVAYPTFNY